MSSGGSDAVNEAFRDYKRRIAELEKQVEHIRFLVMEHKYDHGRFPYQTFLAALEGNTDGS